jgi:hypothetical protein
MALDTSELDLPPEDDNVPEEKTAAFDPDSMGLLDDSPTAEPDDVEEKTAAFDPEAMGLVDAPATNSPSSEERTAAFDPGVVDALDREPVVPPPPPTALQGSTNSFHPSHLSHDATEAVADQEERTVAMDVPPEFFDDESEPNEAPTPEEPPAPAEVTPPAQAPPQPERGFTPSKAPQGAPLTGPPDTRSSASRAARSPARLTPVTGRMDPPSLVSTTAAQTANGGSSMPLPALIGGAVVLVGVVLGLFFVDFGGEPSPSSSTASEDLGSDEADDDAAEADELVMKIPATSTLIVSAKLSRLWKSWLFRAFEEAIMAEIESERDYATFKEHTGIALQDIKRVEAGLDPSAKDFAPLALIALKRLKPKKLEAFLKDEFRAPSAEIEGVTFYREDKRSPLVGVIGPKRIALGAEKELQAALNGPSWKKNKDIKRAFALLRTKATLRAVIPLVGPIIDELPMDALPMGKAVKRGDLIAVSVDADDALIVEVAYLASGDDGAARLDTVYEELKGTLEMIKAERKSLIKEAGDEVPPAAINAAKAALDSVKLERNDKSIFLSLKVAKSELEPLVALAKEMLPPAPAKAKAKARRKHANTEDSEADDSIHAGALPTACKRLITCCDQLVKTVPAASASCDIQREAFKQAALAPASARAGIAEALAAGCKATLDGFRAFPDAPPICANE